MRTAGKINDELLYDAISKQLLFEQLREGLEKIEYRPDDGLAARWRLADGILIDPELNFGKPVVAETGTSTAILARQFVANGENAKVVADLYDLSERDVLHAVAFEARFGRLAA